MDTITFLKAVDINYVHLPKHKLQFVTPYQSNTQFQVVFHTHAREQINRCLVTSRAFNYLTGDILKRYKCDNIS